MASLGTAVIGNALSYTSAEIAFLPWWPFSMPILSSGRIPFNTVNPSQYLPCLGGARIQCSSVTTLIQNHYYSLRLRQLPTIYPNHAAFSTEPTFHNIPMSLNVRVELLSMNSWNYHNLRNIHHHHHHHCGQNCQVGQSWRFACVWTAHAGTSCPTHLSRHRKV